MFQGFLIPTQFQELELLQDRDNMNFVRDVFCLFFTDMTRQFSEIEQILWVKKCMNRTLINAKWLSWRFYWNFYNTHSHIYMHIHVYIYTQNNWWILHLHSREEIDGQPREDMNRLLQRLKGSVLRYLLFFSIPNWSMNSKICFLHFKLTVINIFLFFQHWCSQDFERSQ